MIFSGVYDGAYSSNCSVRIARLLQTFKFKLYSIYLARLISSQPIQEYCWIDYPVYGAAASEALRIRLGETWVFIMKYELFIFPYLFVFVDIFVTFDSTWQPTFFVWLIPFEFVSRLNDSRIRKRPQCASTVGVTSHLSHIVFSSSSFLSHKHRRGCLGLEHVSKGAQSKWWVSLSYQHCLFTSN